MIDPSLDVHRTRLAADMDHWKREFETYRKMRRESLINYVGTMDFAKSLGTDAAPKKPMLANLIQLGAVAHATTLAFAPPRYVLVANNPQGEAVAMRGKHWLNNYLPMIGIGNVARQFSLDSYFGFGIISVDYGLLPPGVQHLTGQQVGPMCSRVSQDHFGYDGNATEWNDVAYIYHEVFVPLEHAKTFEPFLLFNPEGAAKLSEYSRTNEASTDGRVHKEGTGKRAVAMVKLVNVFFPHANISAVWPANDGTFKSVNDKPLLISPWKGHHTGRYAVLSHLDIPDNLIPVAQLESTKGLHFLFNELCDITSQQARDARFNPTFEMGSQRDMERWMASKDREPIAVGQNAKLGALEIPGPTQSQTSYMHGVYQMWNEFAGNPRDTMGMGATAPTARQSELIRAATTVRGAEARRRMDEAMELVARKALHLALNDPNHRFPSRVQLPRTRLSVDMSWLPAAEMPRTNTADDFGLTIVRGSMEYRSPETRLAQLNEASSQILQMAMAAAQGAPVDLEKVVETQAEYRDLPELRDWWAGLLPEYQQAKAAASGMGMNADKPNGNYTRTNVSERTGAGAMTEAFTQFSDAPMGGEAA